MKANELRIGNLITIDSLTDGSSNIVVCDTFHLIEMNNTIKYQYNPIPLTEEWLIKFGFDYKIKSDYCKWYLWSKETQKGIELYEEDYGYIFNEDVNIKHVHQLQNLYFALTGEELTIKE